MRLVFRHGLAQNCWKQSERAKLSLSWAENELFYGRQFKFEENICISNAISALFESLHLDLDLSDLNFCSELKIVDTSDLRHQCPPAPKNFKFSEDLLSNVVVPDNLVFPKPSGDAVLNRIDFDLYSCRKSIEVWSFLHDLISIKSDWLQLSRVFDYCDYVSKNLVLRHAHLLQSKLLNFEKSFKFYEQGLRLISNQEDVSEILLFYLSEFISYYKSFGIERFRMLFNESISKVSSQKLKNFVLLNFYAEASFGRPHYAVHSLKQNISMLNSADASETFDLLMTFLVNQFGLASITRNIFETVLPVLESSSIIKYSIIFSNFEQISGEFQRAREILSFAARKTTPKSNIHDIWNIWKNFELKHGNENSFAEFNSAKSDVQYRADLKAKESEIKFV
ncbi:hypothetical protein GEMRC1_009188 [Eukaryota sp. GEM-RC1]